MSLSISKKLVGGFGIVVVVLIALVTFNFSGISRLRILQDEGASRAKDAVVAEEFKGMPTKMYQIIADAVINRNLQEAKDDWKIVTGEYEEDLALMKELVDTDTEKEWLDNANQIYKKDISDIFLNKMFPLLAVSDANTMVEIRKLDSEIDGGIEEFGEYIVKIAESLNGEMREADEEFDKTGATTSTATIILALIGIIGSIVISFMITRSIVGPVNAIISDLSMGSDQVDAASNQLSGASQQLAQGASVQASSLEEISSNIEELSSMTKQNADNASEANKMGLSANQAGAQSKTAVTKMNGAVQSIKKSSDETAQIIKTIDEIAMQTNLLALNAAVEAARAGEAGRGFAVVAEEVRNLAQRSAEAAKNTAELIEGMQKTSENGVSASMEVEKAIIEITETVDKMTGLLGEVSAASEEQAKGINQITASVNQLNDVTQQNAANSEESASSSEELSAQAQGLNSSVSSLRALVDGTSEMSVRTQKTLSSANYHASEKRTFEPTLRKSYVSHKKEVTPEQMLPFDNDKDLEDF